MIFIDKLLLTEINNKRIERRNRKHKSKLKQYYPPIFDLCWCQKHCNEIVYGGKKYATGHTRISWNRNKKGLQVSWKRPKLSDGTWYPHIPITCQCSKINCNEICWNGNYKPGHNKKFEGRTHKDYTKKIMSDKAWTRRDEAKEFLSERFKGDKNPSKRIEIRDKISTSLKEYFLDPKARKKNSDAQKEFYKTHSSPKLHIFSALDHLIRDKYCPKFNNEFREEVRIRDNHVCQLCNKTQEQNGRKLAVHHIHGDKSNCYPDCIVLCHKCNLVIVEKRGMKRFYEFVFMNMLNNRGLLFWTKKMIK